MDNSDYITEEPEYRRGQHLQREERGTIQHLHRMKWTLHQIAKQVDCSASTVLNELQLDTPPQTGSREELATQKSEDKRCIASTKTTAINLNWLVYSSCDWTNHILLPKQYHIHQTIYPIIEPCS